MNWEGEFMALPRMYDGTIAYFINFVKSKQHKKIPAAIATGVIEMNESAIPKLKEATIPILFFDTKSSSPAIPRLSIPIP